MGHTLTHNLSPLEQVRRHESVTLAGTDSQLSAEDQASLRRVLETEPDYVDSELFRRRDAEKKIFDEAPDIPRPDTSWYHPVMENLTPTRVMKKTNVNTTLLNATQERYLFLQFNYYRFKLATLREKIGQRKPTARQARQLLEFYHKTEEYRDWIAQTNLALVLAMAKRTRMSEVDFADLVSEGNMALLRAVDKFDVARGFKFSTYACRAILKAFSRSGVKLSKHRQLFPTDFDPKLERSDYMDRKRAAHEDDCVDEIKQMLDNNRAALTDIEQEVIEHRFALGEQRDEESDGKQMTLEQVGKVIGVTKERVRQIQNKALEKLRHCLEETYLG